jgi:Tfp pilus assembly protein PilX
MEATSQQQGWVLLVVLLMLLLVALPLSLLQQEWLFLTLQQSRHIEAVQAKLQQKTLTQVVAELKEGGTHE